MQIIVHISCLETHEIFANILSKVHNSSYQPDKEILPYEAVSSIYRSNVSFKLK